MALNHRDALQRILYTYPMGGEGLIAALIAYCNTVAEQAGRLGLDAVASTVCEGMHDGPAEGLSCKRCYDAISASQAMPQLIADIELAEKLRREAEERAKGR